MKWYGKLENCFDLKKYNNCTKNAGWKWKIAHTASFSLDIIKILLAIRENNWLLEANCPTDFGDMFHEYFKDNMVKSAQSLIPGQNVWK